MLRVIAYAGSYSLRSIFVGGLTLSRPKAPWSPSSLSPGSENADPSAGD
jgi:hypothetical protein